MILPLNKYYLEDLSNTKFYKNITKLGKTTLSTLDFQKYYPLTQFFFKWKTTLMPKYVRFPKKIIPFWPMLHEFRAWIWYTFHITHIQCWIAKKDPLITFLDVYSKQAECWACFPCIRPTTAHSNHWTLKKSQLCPIAQEYSPHVIVMTGKQLYTRTYICSSSDINRRI